MDDFDQVAGASFHEAGEPEGGCAAIGRVRSESGITS
jgi:hypothetical protein